EQRDGPVWTWKNPRTEARTLPASRPWPQGLVTVDATPLTRLEEMPAMTARAAVILAAGQGTRMKSKTPKVLHKVGGRTLLDRMIDTVEATGCERIVVVVGTHSPEVRRRAAERLGEAAVAVQDPPLGTAHAVLAAKDALADFNGDVVITYADAPLLTPQDL